VRAVRRLASVVSLLVVGFASAGCRPQPVGSSVGRETGSPAVEMVIVQDWRVGGLLTEGGYSFVEVRTLDGTVVDRQIVPGYVTVSTTRMIDPGTFVVGDIRGCPGWCADRVTWGDQRLDEPVVSCRKGVEVPVEPRFVVVFVVTDLDGPTRCAVSIGV